MLSQLTIRDFAIIDEVELEFLPGFTVVTGETGAGKSILVGALNLILGGRASTDVIRAGAEQAQVEALFDISQHPVVRARLEQRDLVGDDLNTLLVRRVIGSKGKGKVTLNGHLATVASLQEIVRGLVDISGQHEQVPAHPVGREEPGPGAETRQQQALGQQLPDEPAAPCPDREPHAHLARPGHRACHEDVRHVGADDQEQEANAGHEDQQWRAIGAANTGNAPRA